MTIAISSRAAAISLLLLSVSGICAPAMAQQQPAQGIAEARRDAKNVILFIGDGMSIPTVTAARIYDGQSRGETGEENLLSFEHFPNVALVKTYNTDQQVPDSAGTATAINTGVKTRAGVIGIGPAAHRGDCAELQAAVLPTMAELAHARGKAVGFVSTMRLTHATPAAVYAHAADRDWESDADMPAAERAKGCPDIAAQMLAFPFDVALGGGGARFRAKGKGGRRLDPATNLIAQWQGRTGGTLVTTKAELVRNTRSKGPLLGLFAGSHLKYMLERQPDTTEPTLSEMTAAAIDKAAQNPQGYFLMIEGGNIDHGHHEGRADIALSETQELSRAVQVALDKVDLTDTLVLVTADHSHGFTIAGYATRGNPILGLVMGNDKRGNPTGKPTLATDGQPYTTLGYHNGPGAVSVMPRPAPDLGPNARQQALVPTGSIFSKSASLSETHGGDDVALYATGPGSEGARGVIEQNCVFSIIQQAFGWQ